MKAEIYGIRLFLSKFDIKKRSILIPNEFWRDIPNYEGLYRISSLGRIYSYKRRDSKGRLKGGLFKSTPLGRNGNYKFVTLNKNGKKISKDVHRLIMETFLVQFKNQCVNHKNGIKTHNWISNLEWTTQSKNLLHAYRTGLHKGAKGTRIMTWSKARKVRELSKNTPRKELAIMFNCSISCIREIIVNITWKEKI